MNFWLLLGLFQVEVLNKNWPHDTNRDLKSALTKNGGGDRESQEREDLSETFYVNS